MKYKRPQATIQREPISAAYLEYAFSQIDTGADLQNRFRTQSDQLKRREQWDFDNRRLDIRRLRYVFFIAGFRCEPFP
jgi:hypothetical protein